MYSRVQVVLSYVHASPSLCSFGQLTTPVQKEVSAFYTHPLLTNAEERNGITAAWHIPEHIWTLLSLINSPWIRAGPQGRAASWDLPNSQQLVAQPPQPVPCTGSRCPPLPCSGEPGHPLPPPSPSSASPFFVYQGHECSKAVFAQPSALCVPVAQVISS